MEYKSFIDVTPRNDIPCGTKELMADITREQALQALKTNAIQYTMNESGVQTEEIMIDESFRTRYNLYQVDGGIKIVPFIGMTDKSRQQVAIWAGQAQASNMSNEMTRTYYPGCGSLGGKGSKKIFDYAVQIFGSFGSISYK